MSPNYYMNPNFSISPMPKGSQSPIHESPNPISNYTPLTMINSISINMNDFIINNNNQNRKDYIRKGIGILKFVNEKEKFGFFTLQSDGTDVFFHLEDVLNSGIPPSILINSKGNPNVLFKFDILHYIGKYKESRKAINIERIMNNDLNINLNFLK